jgi:hypothetical protein
MFLTKDFSENDPISPLPYFITIIIIVGFMANGKWQMANGKWSFLAGSGH